jgi:hypothetical protein
MARTGTFTGLVGAAGLVASQAVSAKLVAWGLLHMKTIYAALVAVLALPACYATTGATCSAGENGCPCASNDGCDPGLTCRAQRCVSSAGATAGAGARGDNGDTSASDPGVAANDAGKDPRDAGKTVTDASKSPPDATIGSFDGGTSCRDYGPIDKLDLLFMVDNSNSMAEEQGALKAQFPKLISVLTSGQRFAGDPSPFPPAKDIHVGIVSSDMGIPGVNFGNNTNCLPDGGDDGRLQHTPRGTGCDASYPSFLSYSAMAGQSAAKFANDFACVASLGTGGCGFEQQLEAPLKALWPSVFKDSSGNVVTPNPITFLSTSMQGTLGRGDVPVAQGGNAGFLRNDPATGVSLIAIVVVTDEEDCSSRTTEHLKPTNQYPPDSPYAQQDLNLRCFYNPTLMYDVANRYLKGFRLLRQASEQLVVFAAITGVPQNLVSQEVLGATDFSDEAARNKFYDNILNDPRMQQTVDPGTMPGTGMGNLTPSCTRIDATGNVSKAYPPRRIVQLAKLFGENGMVQSICQEDFGPAMDAIINVMAKRFGKGAGCLR